MQNNVSVNDPMYVVRRRLGQHLENTENRQQTADVLEHTGGEMDAQIKNSIRSDYEEEIGDASSDIGGPPQGAPSIGGGMSTPEENMDQEEIERRIQKFMRVSSLQVAYQAYPVAKHVVMN